MVVITSTEFGKNVNKYMEIATTQKVVIQRSETETLELHIQDDLLDDFNDAITFEELMVDINFGLEKMFKNKPKK